MGQRISIYLSDEALDILDALVKQNAPTFGFKPNRSGFLNDLLIQYGGLYMKQLHAIREAIQRLLPERDLDKDHGDTDEDALVEEYMDGPLMKLALAIARGEEAA